jgi:type IV secretory pathway VirB9-like protein
MKHTLALAVILFWSSLFVAGPSEAKYPQHKPKLSPPALEAPAAPTDSEPAAKTVHYGQRDVVKLKTKVGFTTLIVLPQNETILDFVCGDKEYWVVNGTQNFAYVKPAKQGATTNLNLVTAAGNIYTFVLVEVSKLPDTEPDLKVFVEPIEQSMVSAADQLPRFVPFREVEDFRQQVEIAKAETLRTKEAAQATMDAQIGKFLSETRFTYRFDPDKKPFHIKAIYHDEKFTYIQGEPEETPTLYEIRDGKPNLVNFEYKNGVYVAEKVIDRGYLAIGKNRLLFVRHE